MPCGRRPTPSKGAPPPSGQVSCATSVSGLNTLGALCGVVLSGFVLLAALGERRTIAAALALNAVCALGAWLARARVSAGPAPIAQKAHADFSPDQRLFLFLFALSGFCSLGFEVLWSSRLMILLSGTQLVALIAVQSQDRYLAGAVLPLVPFLAGVATQSQRLPRLAAGWSGLVLVGFVAFFAFGEQDHMAWEAASAAVARSLLVTTSGLEMRFTYSLEGSLVEIPYFDQTGRLPPGAGPDPRIPWALNGPSSPRYTLCYARQGDPRAGQDYESAAPGRIVVSTAGAGGSCPQGP